MANSNKSPVLARVYRSTVQRISCHLKLFSSYATFILICECTRKIYVWVGIASSIDDAAIAESVAFNVLQDDFQNLGEIISIREGMEHQQKLSALMSHLLMTVGDYVELSALRGTVLENVPITLSIIERERNDHDGIDFSIKPLSHSTLGRSGNVLPLPFLSSLDHKTIALLKTGNQYDIWFAESIPRRERAAVKAYVVEIAMYHVPEKLRATEATFIERNLHVISQEKSSALFRENFTLSSRHLISSSTKQRPAAIRRKSVTSTNAKSSQQKCSDCVGDAILRLLGISSKPSPATSSSNGTRAPSNFSSADINDDEVLSTGSACGSDRGVFCAGDVISSTFSPIAPSSSSASATGEGMGCCGTDAFRTEMSSKLITPQRSAGDVVSMKLLRLANRTEILFINQPRRNTKLLVLDLDHTLMDFSCRFDYMADQLKRPFLDAFLAQSYLYYDIAVWSQTNFKWLELKLTELGMLNRRDYKICFALDKSTMFTVRQQYVKPLEVIWAKCSSLGWGPHNTIHVDDLERNFELNKQSGVLISPFHLKPFTINPCDGLGESLLDGTVQSPPPIMSLSQGSSIDSNGLSEMDAETAENGPDISGGNGLVDSAYVRLRSSELSHSTVEEKEEQSSGPDASEGNRNKSFEDIELQLLARYLVYIAVTVSDFSSVDHSHWRSRALEMPSDL